METTFHNKISKTSHKTHVERFQRILLDDVLRNIFSLIESVLNFKVKSKEENDKKDKSDEVIYEAMYKNQKSELKSIFESMEKINRFVKDFCTNHGVKMEIGFSYEKDVLQIFRSCKELREKYKSAKVKAKILNTIEMNLINLLDVAVLNVAFLDDFTKDVMKLLNLTNP